MEDPLIEALRNAGWGERPVTVESMFAFLREKGLYRIRIFFGDGKYTVSDDSDNKNMLTTWNSKFKGATLEEALTDLIIYVLSYLQT